jgi:hypothetical protein
MRTAGRSIIGILNEALTGNMWNGMESETIAGAPHGKFYKLGHLLSEDTKIFTSIRNPYDTAVSTYESHRNPPEWFEDTQTIKHAKRFCFSDWLKHYYNWPSFYDYVRDKDGRVPSRIKFVKFENLAEDLERVLNEEFKLGLKLDTTVHIHDDSRPPIKLEDYYVDRASVDIINEKYKWIFDKGFYKRI